jgi:hypothetical protein
MTKLLSSPSLVAFLMICTATTVSAADGDPIVGTWKLNVAKSVFAGIPKLQSQIRTYSGSAPKFTLKMVTVSAAGKETTTQATYQLDGKDYPSMGNLDFDSLAGVQLNKNTAEFTLKRAGKAVGKIRRTVSEDGRTLTVNYVLTNADGIQTSAVTVFDKQ